jgi:hypothetical protein
MARRTMKRRSRAERRLEAEARNAERAKLTPAMQLALISDRRGNSEREMMRLQEQIVHPHKRKGN